jgi:hypothetical protein
MTQRALLELSGGGSSVDAPCRGPSRRVLGGENAENAVHYRSDDELGGLRNHVDTTRISLIQRNSLSFTFHFK